MAAEADLAKKRLVRGGHRSSATRMVTKVDELLAEESPSIASLAQMKPRLVEKLDVLKQLDEQILELITEEARLIEEVERCDDFRGTLHAAIVKIDDYCSRTRTLPPTDATPPPAARYPPTESAAAHKVRLPKLTIRPFNGELTAWTTFWDSYKTAIHESPTLSDIDKFNYLRSLLERTALDAVSGLTLTAANYREAVQILEKRFGNKQQIIAKHMDALLSTEAVSSPHNTKAVRHLYDSIESHVRSLKSLGVTADSYGTLLTSVLLNKLPQELRLMISRCVGEDDWNLDALMKQVEKEVQARERAAAVTTGHENIRKSTSKDPPTAATLLTGGSSNSPTCSYCRQSHSSNSCGVVSRPEDRKRVLQRSGRCFVCLRRGHLSRACDSNKKCHKCGGRHHVSICFKNWDTRSLRDGVQDTTPVNVEHKLRDGAHDTTPVNVEYKPTTSTPTTTTLNKGNHSLLVRPGLNPEAPIYQSSVPHTSLWVNSGRTILLQTALAQVCNPKLPQISRRVRIVLDSGSDPMSPRRSGRSSHLLQKGTRPWPS